MNVADTYSGLADFIKYLKIKMGPTALMAASAEERDSYIKTIEAGFAFEKNPVNPTQNKIKAMIMAAGHLVFNVTSHLRLSCDDEKKLCEFLVEVGQHAVDENKFYGFAVEYPPRTFGIGDCYVFFVGSGAGLEEVQPGHITVNNFPREIARHKTQAAVILLTDMEQDQTEVNIGGAIDGFQETPWDLLYLLNNQCKKLVPIFSARSVDDHWVSCLQYVS